MRLKILLIAAVLAVCAWGAVFAKGIAEERATHDGYGTLTEQANTYIEKSDNSAAIPLLMRMHELKPGELWPIEQLGNLYTHEDRPAFTNALFWLTEAEKRGSSDSSVYYNFACIYSLKGEIEKAEAEMYKALALGYYDFEWMSKDDDLVNFRTGSLWESIADNYTQIEQQLTLFNEYDETGKSIEDRITFYSGIVTALKEIAPNISAPQYIPLFCLAYAYGDNGNYAIAEQYYLEAAAIFEKALGKEHPEYAKTLNNRGWLYDAMGDYAKAEFYYLEVAAIFEKALGKEHPDYATSLGNLGALYLEMGDYAKAERYDLEAAAIYEKALGKEHPDYATSLFSLGKLYKSMGDYAKAERYHLEALAIREKALGKDHLDYATSLISMGNLYQSMGDYAKAERYFLDAAAIYEKTLGKEHPYYATLLDNLGSLYSSMGDYAKVERYELEAAAIREKALGKEHPDYAGSLFSIGELYRSLGDYAKAERYYLEAMAIYEKALGKEHPSYAGSLIGLGALYWEMGDYAKAERYYLEAMAIYEKALGKEHPSYATLLNNLGTLYASMGDYAKAEHYHLEAAAIWEKTLGKEHPSYATSLNNLGVLYYRIGDYAKAESYYLEAAAIREKALGKEHPYYASSLNNLYTLYLSKKEYAKALAYKQEHIKINIGIVNRNFSFQTEHQRDAYWNANSRFFEYAYSLSFYNPVPESNILNYETALFSKGILLRTANAVRDAIYASGDQALIAQFEELGGLHQQISALRQSGGNEEYIKSLETQAEALDKSLTQSSAAFRDLKTDLAINWQTIQKSLQKNEAAIEFVSFRIYDKKLTDTVQYAALVIKKDSKAPVWVLLCKEGDLREILDKAEGRSSEQQARILYNANGLELFEYVWKPLEQELKGVTTVYYSPSGLLYKIAFNALPVDDSYNKRLTDRYNLNLVSSTSEVVHLSRSKKETAQITSAVLYGGLDYNADENAMKAAAQSYHTETATPAISFASPEGVTRGAAWIPLPATRVEVQNIQGYLNKKKIANTMYQGSMGNEESFRQLSGKKTGLIHLATHGFFLPDPERKNDDGQQQQSSGALKPIDNPLLRSGILLAGGNHAWTNEPVAGVESGILTAAKIAGMNLLGAKLVVLSACQTGLGDVKNGEGVFGLQRAFKLAGVETLIMSLWEVDDAATALLMSTFYNEWLISGKSRQEAFKEAQKKVRAKYPMPFYWAAFVMMD
ncbi:hypothetical protein R84B8_01927 [Treponema sp. R8-4-B8]